MKIINLLLTITLVSSCGHTVQTAAHASLEATARELVALDRASAIGYQEEADRALNQFSTIVEYRHHLEPWSHLEELLRKENGFLLDARTGLMKWELYDDPSEFNSAMTCVTVYINRILIQMSELSIVYDYTESRSILDKLVNWSVGECNSN